MKTQFDRELTELKVYATGNELISVLGMDRDAHGRRITQRPESEEVFIAAIPDPVLVTDKAKIFSGIFPENVRNNLDTLFDSHRVRITDYDGTILRFDPRMYPTLWGPSIDTLLFCRALTRVDFGGVHTALEMCAGSGFISKRFLNSAPELSELEAVDLNQQFVCCANKNITDQRFRVFSGDAIRFMQGRKYDRILCNPPYLPRKFTIEDNAYEGLGVLVYTIRNGCQHLNPGGKSIINISSLSGITPESAQEMAQAPVVVVDQMTVPLKVFPVLNDPEWMKFLINEKGLRADYHDGHTYWHTIQILEIAKQ